jgi:type II secretory pathway pseudopilin PulG
MNRNRRTGATLIEVLVAIFIMGIGLLALLTLFPLGALLMAQAIRDDRAGQAGEVAHSLAAVKGYRTDANVQALFLTGAAGAGLNQASTDGRSYPVYVDPIGYRSAFPLPGYDRVAGLPQLPRVLPSFLANIPDPTVQQQTTYRWFTLLDDIVFDNFGNANQLLPANPPASMGVIERDTRFSWAYLIQRPRTGEPSIAEVSVIVYDNRPLSLTGGLSLPETAYSKVVFNPATSVITVTYDPATELAPQVRTGSWVLDLSTVRGETHAFFYRVASVEDDGTVAQIEVQQPLRGFGSVSFGPTGPNAGDAARLVVLEGVAEVFERGLGKLP